MPAYTFRFSAETLWFFVIVFLTPIFSALAVLDETSLTNWQPWVVGVFAASVRALAAAIIAKLGPGGFKAS